MDRKLLHDIIDKADDGQEDCETVHLTISAGEARYLRDLLAKPDPPDTSPEVAEHAGRLLRSGRWQQFARMYNSDEKAWEAIRSVAASTVRQTT